MTPISPVQRNEHLDGFDALRGVAAFSVLLYHFAGRINLPYVFAHGYLAVDFFFLLSGFVIAHAYGGRIRDETISVGKFYILRAIRLLPLIVLGTLLAAIIEYGRPVIADQGHHVTDVIICVALGSLLFPTFFDTTLEHVLFPLNGPAWSLYLEAWSNIAFAPIKRFRAEWILGPVALISAATLLFASHDHRGLNIGSSAAHLWFGFARIGWAFGLGMIMYRLKGSAPCIPFWVPVTGLVAIFAAPPLGEFGPIFDDCSVLVALPCVMFASVAVKPGNIWRSLSWLGEISFSLYAIHYPLVRAFSFKILQMHLLLPGRVSVIIAGAATIIFLSALAYKFYDIPVRRRLHTIFIEKNSMLQPQEHRAPSSALEADICTTAR